MPKRRPIDLEARIISDCIQAFERTRLATCGNRKYRHYVDSEGKLRILRYLLQRLGLHKDRL